MKKILFSILILSIISLSAFAQNKEEPAVAQAVENWKKAVLSFDKVGLEASVSENLRYGHSNGKMENKTEFVEAIISKSSVFVTMDLTEQKISFVNKNTAIVTHKLAAITKNNGVDGTAKLHLMQVWQKEKGKWVMVARQATKI